MNINGEKKIKPDESRFVTSTVVSGIPQGTILDPLLFSLFVTNVSDGLLHS